MRAKKLKNFASNFADR